MSPLGDQVLGHVLGQGSSCRVYAAAGPEGAVPERRAAVDQLGLPSEA